MPGTVLTFKHMSEMPGALFFLLIGSQPGRGDGQWRPGEIVMGQRGEKDPGRLFWKYSEPTGGSEGIREGIQRRGPPVQPEDGRALVGRPRAHAGDGSLQEGCQDAVPVKSPCARGT